jgi:hypothetical protein
LRIEVRDQIDPSGKAAARLFAEAGCSEHEIAAWTGHASLREVRRYTKAVNQERLAVAAAQKLMKAKA